MSKVSNKIWNKNHTRSFVHVNFQFMIHDDHTIKIIWDIHEANGSLPPLLQWIKMNKWRNNMEQKIRSYKNKFRRWCAWPALKIIDISFHKHTIQKHLSPSLHSWSSSTHDDKISPDRSSFVHVPHDSVHSTHIVWDTHQSIVHVHLGAITGRARIGIIRRIVNRWRLVDRCPVGLGDVLTWFIYSGNG